MNTVVYTISQKFCKILERVHSKINILLIATLAIQNDGNGYAKSLGKFFKVFSKNKFFFHMIKRAI